MKTAIIPQVRIEPQLRADLHAVLRDGETLSEFVESTVRAAVEHRLVQSAFAARADEAWVRFQRTGAGRPAEDVIIDMRTSLAAKRKELQSRRRPADVWLTRSSSRLRRIKTYFDCTSISKSARRSRPSC